MNHKLALAVASILAMLPVAAGASEITYDFTGTVASAAGADSGIAIGTLVTGTYTFDFDASVAGQGAGIVGAASDWVVQSDGGSLNATVSTGPGVAHLPAPVPSTLVFSSTATVGGVSYATAPTSSYLTEAYIANQGFQFGAGENISSSLYAGTGSFISLVRANYSVLPFLSDGLPNPSGADLGTSEGYFDAMGGSVLWNFTSLSVSPVPLPAGFWLFASGFGVLLAVSRLRFGRVSEQGVR